MANEDMGHPEKGRRNEGGRKVGERLWETSCWRGGGEERRGSDARAGGTEESCRGRVRVAP